MELEHYFDFLSKDDIRVKRTRVGIETILEDYFNGSSPEEIAMRYRSVSLEQVYATITYYLHNRNEVDTYLNAWRENAEQAWQAHQRNVPDVTKRLRQLKQERAKAVGAQP